MLKARRSTAVTLCQRGFLAWSSSSRTYSSGLQKRVAVIGAGSSGVAAAKCAKDEGFDVVTFEKSDTIGGNWVFREEENHSSVYRTTSINTSKDMMSYADYPMPKHLGPFPDRVELCQYFNDYAEHFDVKKTIRFNTNVDQVKQLADGRWEITYKPTQSKSSADATKEVFDSVLVCNGHHWNPRWPKFPGMEKFEGKQQHSHSYKDPYPYKDKRVLVVGIGNSGVDVATEASRWTSKLFMSTRSGAYVMPKYVLGQPIDALFGSRAGVAAPLWVRTKMLDLVLNAIHGPMSQWGLQPKGFGAFGAHPTVSSDFLPRIGTGSVVIKPNVKEIKAKEVVFEDGSVEEIDTIIYATGYKITFPFFEDSLKLVDEDNNIPLYKHIFPTHVKNLAFIGLIQPLGAIFPIAEMQSRWATRVFNGKNSLPSVAAMEADIKNKLEAMKKRYNRSPRHTIQVDYIEYMDELADQFGAKPKVWSHGMQLAMALYFGPATPIQYRLDGPGAWAGAKDEIISKFKDHTRNLLYRTTPKAQHQPQHSSRNNTPLATL